jgi:hypothetical protein
LADRAVPVPTRFQNVVEFLALLASINDASRVWRSATHDRNHGLDLIRRHTVSELFQVSWSVGSEDFTDRGQTRCNGLLVAQDFLFMIELILAIAFSSPTVVTWR